MTTIKEYYNKIIQNSNCMEKSFYSLNNFKNAKRHFTRQNSIGVGEFCPPITCIFGTLIFERLYTDDAIAKLYMTKCWTIYHYLTKLYVTKSFTIALSVISNEIRQNTSTVIIVYFPSHHN